jgi:hypothetical protein
MATHNEAVDKIVEQCIEANDQYQMELVERKIVALKEIGGLYDHRMIEGAAVEEPTLLHKLQQIAHN